VRHTTSISTNFFFNFVESNRLKYFVIWWFEDPFDNGFERFFIWGQNYDETIKLFDYVLNVNESIQVENVNNTKDDDLPIMMHDLKWLMKL
jgi:hypothetical protein